MCDHLNYNKTSWRLACHQSFANSQLKRESVIVAYFVFKSSENCGHGSNWIHWGSTGSGPYKYQTGNNTCCIPKVSNFL